jgi:hypothetical protein
MAVAECDIVTGLSPIELSPLPAKPLVSILISNYNYTRYLGESMESALRQTVIRVSASHRRQGVWPMSAPLPRGWYGARLLKDGGILPFMPPTSGLSLHRDVAGRIFPLPLEAPLVSCPDQLITRLAPLTIATWPAPAGTPDLPGFGGSRFTCLTRYSISPSICWFGRAGSSR